jgi:hypothetical protein
MKYSSEDVSHRLLTYGLGIGKEVFARKVYLGLLRHRYLKS